MLLYPNLLGRKPTNYHGPPRSDLQLTNHQKKNCGLWHIVEAFVIGDFTHHHSDFAILPMLDRDVEFVSQRGWEYPGSA